ncbi:hypothetical protein S40285_07375 [Stachybotrys chlorohalonatus IBT 40285]|uniref:PLC-like phosphodiesterase n=1 Tax=Stachybotrys chlorohalonatus (strain IBT 40285) TaxID=1283841 RepID=A0A084QSB1_STAC4|nr:hypothetical protein S40285_07375 [Stachybotrys chlorohalonata IBT 40285]
MAPAIAFDSPEDVTALLQAAKTADEVKQIADRARELSELPSRWMEQLLPIIGERTLETICVPRSHDAGMYLPVSYRRLGSPSTVITQTRDILSQLKLGVRMFDLRPCIVKGEFYCEHYSYIGGNELPDVVKGAAGFLLPVLTGYYHGGEGAKLRDIISMVNEFVKDRREVVILEITHTFNFDREVQNSEWGFELNTEEWKRLTDELCGLSNLYVSDQGPNCQVTKLKINELLASGQSAVMVTTARPGGVDLDPTVAGKGFYEQGILDPLRGHHISYTQSTVETVCAFLYDTDKSIIAKGILRLIAKTVGGDSPYLKDELWSIVDVARLRKFQELPKVYQNVSAEEYPNLISMDTVEDEMLLAAVFRVLGKVITGRDASLVHGEDGQWAFQ